jgi:two-component system, OmpR family, sensor kinase
MRPDRHPHSRLLLPWVALAVTCMALMLSYPGGETVPYHVGWIGLGVAYGLDPWPLRWASAAVVGYAVTTGAVLVDRAVHGVIAWEETTEIPLMAILVILMIWHVNRRLSAFAALDRLHRHERTRAERREWMAGLVSHEIKTTVTVAGGYLELAAAGTGESTTRAHVEVARHELHSLTRASERLIRMMGMQENFPLEVVDGADIMRQVAERWSAVAERDWSVDVAVGQIACAPQRLRACVDTLIENSLRHTPTGGRIRLVGLRLGDYVCLGVADSGPGFSDVQLETINQLGPRRVDGRADEQYRPQGGLGLSLVHELAIERGGRLSVGRSAEGGALVLIVLPAAAVSVEERPSPGHVRSLTQPQALAGLVSGVVSGPHPSGSTSRAEGAPSFLA